jgi:hypothetical protein
VRFATTFLLTVGLAAAACGPKATGRTGDETRSGATDIRPGTTFDDKVSSNDDPVDWKRFVVAERSPAALTVHWDNPPVQATVTLRDGYGGALQQARHAPGTALDRLDATLADGTYFVEIRATRGASVYTVELVLGNRTDSYGVPRPE